MVTVTDSTAKSWHGRHRDTVASWAEPAQILVIHGEKLIGHIGPLQDSILLAIDVRHMEIVYNYVIF